MDISLQLAVQYDHPDTATVLSRDQIRRWVRAALRESAELTIRFTDEDEQRRLNLEFRGKDYATNILTFVYTDSPVFSDIAICLPIVMREALEQGKAWKAHCAHLVVHGVLHAQGWDHEEAGAADAMEAREIEILKRFRISNPYVGDIRAQTLDQSMK